MIIGDEGNRRGRRHMVLHGGVYVFEVVLGRRISRPRYTGYLVGIHSALGRSHCHPPRLMRRGRHSCSVLHRRCYTARTEQRIDRCWELAHCRRNLGLHPLCSTSLRCTLAHVLCRCSRLRRAIEALYISSWSLEIVVGMSILLLVPGLDDLFVPQPNGSHLTRQVVHILIALCRPVHRW